MIEDRVAMLMDERYREMRLYQDRGEPYPVKHDMLDFLMHNTEHKFDRSLICDQILTVLFAGYDTSAVAMR